MMLLFFRLEQQIQSQHASHNLEQVTSELPTSISSDSSSWSSVSPSTSTLFSRDIKEEENYGSTTNNDNIESMTNETKSKNFNLSNENDLKNYDAISKEFVKKIIGLGHENKSYSTNNQLPLSKMKEVEENQEIIDENKIPEEKLSLSTIKIKELEDTVGTDDWCSNWFYLNEIRKLKVNQRILQSDEYFEYISERNIYPVNQNKPITNNKIGIQSYNGLVKLNKNQQRQSLSSQKVMNIEEENYETDKLSPKKTEATSLQLLSSGDIIKHENMKGGTEWCQAQNISS